MSGQRPIGRRNEGWTGKTNPQSAAPAGPPADGHPLDAAIAATEQTVAMTGMRARFPTGRPFAIEVPAYMTWQEFCALVVFVGELPGRLKAQRGPQLVIPQLGVKRQ